MRWIQPTSSDGKGEKKGWPEDHQKKAMYKLEPMGGELPRQLERLSGRGRHS